MSHPNPLLPPGSSLDDRKQRKTKILVTVFGIVALHVVPISGLLLMQGCKTENSPIATSTEKTGNPAAPQTVLNQPNDEIPILNTNDLYQDFETDPDGLTLPIAMDPAPTGNGTGETRSTELILDEIEPAPVSPSNTAQASGGAGTNRPNSRSPIEPTPAPELAGVETVFVNPTPEPSAPAPSANEAQTYKIQPGDRLYSLAKQYGSSVDAILGANPGLDARRLRVGKTIVIPKVQASATPQTRVAATPPPAAGTKIYRVKRGDNLTRIATRHGVTLKALRKANNLRSDRILIDQKLTIPVAEMASATQ